MITENRGESSHYETVSEKKKIRITADELQFEIVHSDKNELTITLSEGSLKINPKYANQIQISGE